LNESILRVVAMRVGRRVRFCLARAKTEREILSCTDATHAVVAGFAAEFHRVGEDGGAAVRRCHTGVAAVVQFPRHDAATRTEAAA
jgi:hypothetical protein